MVVKKILVAEGNTKENNLELISNNIETHTQSIHNSLKKLNSNSDDAKVPAASAVEESIVISTGGIGSGRNRHPGTRGRQR